MADEEDIRALRDGNSDLVRRDFRDAELQGLSLRDRDFTQAHLERSNLSRSDLTAGNFSQANIAHANLSFATLALSFFQGSIFGVNFTGADLRGAIFSRCLFTQSNFANADLRGTDFSHSQIQEGTTFEGAIVDETTRFDGVGILRATARQDAFRFYAVDRGTLIRKPERTEESVSSSKEQVREQLVRQIDALTAELQRLGPVAETGAAHAGMGHNNPPEAIPVDKQEHAALQAALATLKEQATAAEPDSSRITDAQSRLVEIGGKILRRLASHADTAAEEFAKGLGKNLSDPLRLAAAWTLFSGGLSTVVSLARSYFGI